MDIGRHKNYIKLCELAIYVFPLIFLLPQQFYRNLYFSPLFWVIISYGLALLLLAVRQIKKRKTQTAMVLFLIYLICLAITSFFSTNLSKSLPILLLNSAYFLIFLSVIEVLKTQKSKEFLVGVILGVTTVLSLISAYDTLFRRYINSESEGLSFMWIYFGHNHLAVLLLISIPICIYFAYKSSQVKFKVYFTLVLFWLIFNLFITYSRAGMIALIVSLSLGFLISGILITKRMSLSNKLTPIIAVLVIGFLLIYVSYHKYDYGVFSRISTWQKGIEVFEKYPFFGTGLGSFEAQTAEKVNKRNPFFAHNILIQSAAETGLVGLITQFLLLTAIISTGLSIKKERDIEKRFFYTAIWIGLVGVLLNEMLDFDLQIPSVAALFWLLAGIVYFSVNSKST